MCEKAKVVGMMPADERVQDVARAIIDDVVEIQGASSGFGLNRAGLAALRNIQMQARGLLTGKPAPVSKTPEIAGGYRLDVLEVLQGLSEQLCCDTSRQGAVTDEELRVIALAAEAAHSRINNYLLVRRMENLMQRREAGNGAA
ncbi:MAG: hypothetical protein ACYC9M_02840 [Desulfobulbaceae bacterium]